MKRKLPYLIGSIGWIMCAIHYTSEYLMYGSDFPAHIAQEDLFLSVSIIATIPLFMIVGYLLQREKRTGDKLRESEEKYSTLVKRANDGVVIVQDRGFKFLNDRFAEILGYPTEDLEGMDFAKILSPESAELAEKRYRKRMSGEQVPDIYEMGLLTKKGETVPVEINAAIIEYSGKPADLVYVRDITERKRVEEALQQRSHDLGERVKELNCLYGISKLIETDGITLEEIFQGTVDIIPPSWQYPKVTCTRILFEEKEFRTENFKETEWKQASDIIVYGKQVGTVDIYYLVEMPKSDEGPFLSEERSLINAIGEQLGRHVERKRAEDDIKRAKEFSENLIQESPTAILSTDSNGNVVVINKSAEDLLGYKYDELVGKPLSMAISGQHDLEMADKKDFSLNFVKKDGTEIPISVSTSVQLFKGEQRGLIVTLKDLSELRGLLITPVSEVGVEAEKEYQLEQGSMYIVEEEKPEKSFDVFHDLVKQGSQGLYISRQNPARIKEKYQLEKTPNIWLTRTKIPEGNCISPDELAKLYKTTENFIRQADDGVIFFEGLEYLVAQNGFQPVLKFIQSLNDVIMVHPSRLIVSVDPLTLDTKELHIFKKGMKTIP